MLVRMDTTPKLTPLLIVRDAASAIAFYVQALGAKEISRYLHPAKNTISHADLALGGATISITEEARAWNSDAPPSLGGSPVVLQLCVDDVEAVFETMCRAGASVVFPLQEFAGQRMGRVRDPFGHLWIVSQRIDDLTDEEIGRRRSAFKPAAS
jgi:PhnB protein